MSKYLVGARVVAVHAHPDDEAIWTGGLLFELARRGAEVTVVTCTLGEQGEVIGSKYQGLVADSSDQLGGFRVRELQESLAELGTSGSVNGEFLGGIGCWRDSGMVGDPANEHRRAFIHSGEKAVAQLTELFDALTPDLVITYGPDGGYGHPDHIRAHEITHAAAQACAKSPKRILWAVTEKAALDAGLSAIEEIPEGWKWAEPGEIACVESADFEIALDAQAALAKKAAMRAHPTQLWIADGDTTDVNDQPALAKIRAGESVDEGGSVAAVFALSNLIAQPLLNVEHYQLGAGDMPASKNLLEGLIS